MWLFNGAPFVQAPSDAFGFIYLITNLNTTQRYIGKKHFASYRSKRVKGRRNRKHYKLDSDWQTYWGSCKELLEDIATLGKERFKREIVKLCATRAELTYCEVEHQFKHDVLTARLPDGSRAFYNRNIMNRFYAA